MYFLSKEQEKDNPYFVDTKALMREFHRILSKVFTDTIMFGANTYIMRKTNPRVIHLAYHHRKERVRKKNMNRIRRMK